MQLPLVDLAEKTGQEEGEEEGEEAGEEEGEEAGEEEGEEAGEEPDLCQHGDVKLQRCWWIERPLQASSCREGTRCRQPLPRLLQPLAPVLLLLRLAMLRLRLSLQQDVLAHAPRMDSC